MGALKRATKGVSDRFEIMQRKTEKARKKLAKVGAALKGVGSSMTSRLTAPIVAVGGGIIAMSAKFEKSMNKVQALTGETGDKFIEMRELAKDLGQKTQFSASQAGDAMSFLGMAGFSTNEILQATPGLLDLAASSGIELARAADIASNVMGAFGISASETTRVADILARTTAGANVDMEMIAETMKAAGPVAKQFGASLEETAAATGFLGNVGIQGSLAGTSLKNVFLALSAPTTQAAKTLKRLGIATSDSNGKMLPLFETLKNLGRRFKTLPQKGKMEALKALFGKIGIAGGAAISEFAASGKDFDKFIEKMENTTVTAKGMAATMNKGAAGGVKAMFSAIEGLAIAIGDSGILEMFTDIVKDVTLFVRDLTKSRPKIMKWTFILGLMAAAIGPVLLGLGSMIAILPFVIAGFSALSAALAIPAGLLALIPVAIAAVIAQGVLLYQNWETVKAFAMRIWNAISIFLDSKIGQIMAYMFPFIGIPLMVIKHWEPIKGFFKKVFDSLVSTFGLSVEGMQERSVFFTGIADSIMEKFDALKNFFRDLWTTIKTAFFDKFPKAANFIASALKRIKDSMPTLPDVPTMPDGILPDFKKIKQALKTPEHLEPGTFGPLRPTDTTTAAPTRKNLVEIDFKNMPKGVTVKSDSKTPDFLNLNTGLQGAAL
jgi:TP901 family phage tail tape measure protein